VIKYPYEPTDHVICSCCGALVENVPGKNVSLHQDDGSPYPNDDGYGMCVTAVVIRRPILAT